MQTCPAWHESLNVQRIDRYQGYNNTEGVPRNGAIDTQKHDIDAFL